MTIQTKPTTPEYAQNWDRIFNKKSEPVKLIEAPGRPIHGLVAPMSPLGYAFAAPLTSPIVDAILAEEGVVKGKKRFDGCPECSQDHMKAMSRMLTPEEKDALRADKKAVISRQETAAHRLAADLCPPEPPEYKEIRQPEGLETHECSLWDAMTLLCVDCGQLMPDVEAERIAAGLTYQDGRRRGRVDQDLFPQRGEGMTARELRRSQGKRMARKQARKAPWKATLRKQRGSSALPGTGKRK